MATSGEGGAISFRGEEHPAATRRRTRTTTEIAAAQERAAMDQDTISRNISLYVPPWTSQILILDVKII
jgi:hypothetical protein